MKLSLKKVTLFLALCFLLPTTVFAQTSADDLQKLAQSLSSLQRMIQLVRAQKAPPAKTPAAKVFAQVFALGQDPDVVPLPPAVEAKAQRLQKLTQAEGCQIVLPEEKQLQVGVDSMQAHVTDLHLSIGGVGCPFSVEVNMKAQQIGNQISAQYDLALKSLSDEFKTESDITEATQAGQIEADFSQTAGSQNLILKASIAGTGVSQTLGSFGSSHSFDTTMNFNLPLSIKLKILTEHVFHLKNNELALKSEASLDGLLSGSEKYYFNGQEITKEVFQNLEQGMQFIGLNEKKSDDVPPLLCEFKILDKQRLALQTLSSCQKDVSQDWNYQGRAFNLSLAYKKDWVEAKISQSSSRGEKTIYSLYEEESLFEKEFAGLILQSHCQVVNTCP